MTDDIKAETEAAGDEESEQSGRQRSTIAFPYMSLKDAIEVAEAIYNHEAAGQCDDAQLAAWLGLSPKSSGYRIRLTAARLFGVIESVASGSHKLTDLGLGIVDANRTKESKIYAFLNVPLFSKLFEKWNGRQLPPPAALEREIAGLGVAEKQKKRARQVFESSAQLAGFFDAGKGVLVKPGLAHHGTSERRDERHPGGGGSGGGHKPPLDPIIQGLIDRLPAPGEVWPSQERKLWLGILENSFHLVYKDDGEADDKPAD